MEFVQAVATPFRKQIRPNTKFEPRRGTAAVLNLLALLASLSILGTVAEA